MEQTLKEIKAQFQQNSDKLNQSQFRQLLQQNSQFNLKEDDTIGLDYFNSLDKDQDGFISFRDFLSPFLGQLTPEVTNSLVGDTEIKASDIRKLREIYLSLASDNRVKLEDFTTQAAMTGSPSLMRVLSRILGPFSKRDYLEEVEFSLEIVKLEKEILQSANAHSYFEGNKNISDYILNLDEVNSSKKNQINSEVQSTEGSLANQSSPVKFSPNKRHSMIRDPEVTLQLFVEDIIQNQKWQGQSSEQLQNLMYNLKECSELVTNKVKKIEQRLEMYEPVAEGAGEGASDTLGNDPTLEGEASLNLVTDIIQEARERKGKKVLSRRELQAIEYLHINHKLIQSELSSLREETKGLKETRNKYQKLQSDIQNKAIAATQDSKSILIEFKDQNEKQLKLIETLNLELQRIKKENEVYKRYTKSEKMSLSSDVLQKLIEKSEKEYVDFKNVQLKKVELGKKIEEKKQEAGGYVLEESANVQTLKNMYEGPEAQQKALQKQLSSIEQELQKSQNQVEQKLAQISSEENQIQTQSETSADTNNEGQAQVQANILVQQDTQLQSKQKQEESYAQLLLDQYLLDNQPRNKNILKQLIQETKAVDLQSEFSEHQRGVINDVVKALNISQDLIQSTLYFVQEDSYRITSRNKKTKTLIFLTNSHLVFFSKGFQLQDYIALKDLEQVILFRDEHSILALHSYNKPDVLLELQKERTQFLINLIQIFEEKELQRFKILISNALSIKEGFDFSNVKASHKSQEDESSEDSQQEDCKSPEHQLSSVTSPTRSSQIFGGDQTELNELSELQYSDVKTKILKVDPDFVNQVCQNIYIQCLKHGVLLKKTQKMFAGWKEMFCVLTNAGIIYFHSKTKDEFDPRKFFPLNDYVVRDVDEKTAKKKYAFKIVFHKQEVHKDLILACQSQIEKEKWMYALHLHHRQLNDARIEAFNKRLEELAAK